MASAPMGTSMSHMTCSAGSCGQVREDICMIGGCIWREHVNELNRQGFMRCPNSRQKIHHEKTDVSSSSYVGREYMTQA